MGRPGAFIPRSTSKRRPSARWTKSPPFCSGLGSDIRAPILLDQVAPASAFSAIAAACSGKIDRRQRPTSRRPQQFTRVTASGRFELLFTSVSPPPEGTARRRLAVRGTRSPRAGRRARSGSRRSEWGSSGRRMVETLRVIAVRHRILSEITSERRRGLPGWARGRHGTDPRLGGPRWALVDTPGLQGGFPPVILTTNTATVANWRYCRQRGGAVLYSRSARVSSRS